MAEKTEKKETAPAPDATPAAGGGGKSSWLPAIIAIVLAPAATWGVAQFVLLPKLQATLAASADPEAHAAEAKPAAEHGAAKKSGGHGKEKGGEAAATDGYRFENVVVNLAGTMGTRYLKTSFLVTGKDAGLISRFDESKAQLGDITLAVLSSLTLADLEEPGSKNIIREKLLSAYNQVFGKKIAENLYFSDFVVQ